MAEQFSSYGMLLQKYLCLILTIKLTNVTNVDILSKALSELL